MMNGLCSAWRRSRVAVWLLLTGLFAPVALTQTEEAGPVVVLDSSALAFADAVLDRASGKGGALDVSATLISGSEVESDEGTLEVGLDVAVRLQPRWASGRQLRVTIIAYEIDDAPLTLEETATLGETGAAAWWLYRRVVELPEEFLEAVVVVEDVETGRKGGARVGYGLPLGPATQPRARGGVVVDQRAPAVATAAPPIEPRNDIVRLVPPRGNSHAGEVKLRTLVTTRDVARVEFAVDGKPSVSDDRPPFALEVDLGPDPATHEIVAIAWSAGDRELGRDRLVLNARLELFDLRMALRPATPAAGELTIEAAVSVPRGGELDRVEFYRNDELLRELRQGPFSASIAEDRLGPDDYLRVVAYLEDGTSLDDVRLLSDSTAGERINVNLVQVFAIASDRQGNPLQDLTADDFEIKVGGERVEIERFQLAVDVPLSLGLVFDTSGSMYSLMVDAKQAGAHFLSSIVSEGDRAFLIDFDTRPRLAHPPTSDLGSLLRRFAQLEAKGNTALYDAVVFGTLQFDAEAGRRALVVLTDGVPSGGEFGARHTINLAVQQAVPVYSIDLSGVLSRVSGAKLPLVGLAKATGGRVHTILGDPRALDPYESVGRSLEAAYAQIEAELRSQYVIAFSTPEPLTEEEIKSVKVKVSRPGVKVRRVVGTLSG